MTVRNKLTYSFTVIVISLLILFSSAIYYFSSDYRKNDFYLRLKNKAITTARILMNVKSVNHDLLKEIDKNTVNTLYDGKVLIYDPLNQEIYNSFEKEQTNTPIELLNKIREEKEIRYREGEKEVIGIFFPYKSDHFVVIASAFDKFGLEELENLRVILIMGLMSTVVIIVFAGFFFSGQALEPIADVVKQVDNITVNNLNLRVNEGNGTDEIAQLAIKFNKLLGHLESAFEMQRSFMSNASHELRTPLTAISGQIEIALMNKREASEYENTLQSVWEDIKNLNKLSNGLLDLAQASMDASRIKLKKVRIDEILWQSRDELIKRHNDYTIYIEYKELPEDEKKLIVNGSEQLLKTAVINVMDNACKYSHNKQVMVNIDFDDQSILLQFTDKGIGISEHEMKHVFESFFRTSNSRNIQGHGIGLSLVDKIIHLHKGTIRMFSILNEGTTVTLSLPFER